MPKLREYWCFVSGLIICLGLIIHVQGILYFSSSGSGGQAEGYERTHVTHKDMKFHRFMKRLSLCPEQCIR